MPATSKCVSCSAPPRVSVAAADRFWVRSRRRRRLENDVSFRNLPDVRVPSEVTVARPLYSVEAGRTMARRISILQTPLECNHSLSKSSMSHEYTSECCVPPVRGSRGMVTEQSFSPVLLGALQADRSWRVGQRVLSHTCQGPGGQR